MTPRPMAIYSQGGKRYGMDTLKVVVINFRRVFIIPYIWVLFNAIYRENYDNKALVKVCVNLATKL